MIMERDANTEERKLLLYLFKVSQAATTLVTPDQPHQYWSPLVYVQPCCLGNPERPSDDPNPELSLNQSEESLRL